MPSMNGSIRINFADQTLELLPDRAVWWPLRSTLIIADIHFGKAAAFRSTGVPVPAGATARDLSRLTSLLEQTTAKRLIILGDFLHSRAGRQTEVLGAIASWRSGHSSLAITLVRGNHDRSAGRVPPEWEIAEVEEPFADDGICLAHDPDCSSPCPMLAGHVHPVIALQDYDRSAVTLPCFVHDPMCLILPAFGTFTGGHRINALPGRKIFCVAATRVIAMPGNE